jgi:hypothetical protein
MPRPRKYPEELLERGTRLVFESGRLPMVTVGEGRNQQVLASAPGPTHAPGHDQMRINIGGGKEQTVPVTLYAPQGRCGLA